MRDPKAVLSNNELPESDDLGPSRKLLDDVFQDGVQARQAGTASCDNPYAVGSKERQEWSAGWRATLNLGDRDDEPNSGYEKN